MIMMIVLFFMRFRVSLSFVVNTGAGKGPDSPVDTASGVFIRYPNRPRTLLYSAHEPGPIMDWFRH